MGFLCACVGVGASGAWPASCLLACLLFSLPTLLVLLLLLLCCGVARYARQANIGCHCMNKASFDLLLDETYDEGRCTSNVCSSSLGSSCGSSGVTNVDDDQCTCGAVDGYTKIYSV
jgi:hypothetical protein